jgi:hypothetical protein
VHLRKKIFFTFCKGSGFMHTAKKENHRFRLHVATYRLLLWGLRILVAAAFGTLVYIENAPLLSFSMTKELLHSLCLSAVILVCGAFVLDVDVKKRG